MLDQVPMLIGVPIGCLQSDGVSDRRLQGVPLRTALDKVDAAIAAGGLQWCDQWQNSGNLARPRRAEVQQLRHFFATS